MELTTKNVETVFKDCLYTEEEITFEPPNSKVPKGCVIVEGIVNTFGFHPERLASHKEDIRSMLADLPTEFRENSGGGWSFLNACIRQHDGEQWGEHRNMEQLFCLGIGLGMAKWLLPRNMWNVLPGEMPYVSITV